MRERVIETKREARYLALGRTCTGGNRGRAGG